MNRPLWGLDGHDAAGGAPLPRLAVAFDAPALEPLEPLIDDLAGLPLMAKVGVGLFTAVGPAIVHHLHAAGFAVFLDLGLLDLPSQVALTVAVASRLGVALLSVNAAGGAAMLQAAVAARRGRLQLCGVLWPSGLPDEGSATTGLGRDRREIICHRARLCVTCGIDGVLAGGGDLAILAGEPTPQLRVAVGIRPDGRLPGDDQVWTATPRQALQAGATVLVAGRPLLHAAEPRTVAQQWLAEIDRHAAAVRC